MPSTTPSVATSGDAAAEGPIELYPSKALVWLLVAFGGFFTLMGGGALVGRAFEAAPSEPLLPMVVCLVMGAVTLAFMLPMAVAPRAVVVADARGLHYLPRLGKGETFAWEELAAIGYVRAGKHSGLGLWMRDRDAWIAEQPSWKRPLLRVGNHLLRYDRRLRVICTGGSIEQFAAQVAARFGVEKR